MNKWDTSDPAVALFALSLHKNVRTGDSVRAVRNMLDAPGVDKMIFLVREKNVSTVETELRSRGFKKAGEASDSSSGFSKLFSLLFVAVVLPLLSMTGCAVDRGVKAPEILRPSQMAGAAPVGPTQAEIRVRVITEIARVEPSVRAQLERRLAHLSLGRKPIPGRRAYVLCPRTAPRQVPPASLVITPPIRRFFLAYKKTSFLQLATALTAYRRGSCRTRIQSLSGL
jgi:hypothetical protein